MSAGRKPASDPSAATNRLRIGMASRAHVHADGFIALLAQAPDVDVYVSDPDAPDARDTPDRRDRGLPQEVRYLPSYQELFDLALDGVVIAAETSGHRALIEQAAASGAAILCEKPLATTAQDARVIADTIRRHDVPFLIAYPVRFMSACRELLTRQRSGLLGDVVALRGSNNGKLPVARDWFTDPDLAGGGALFDHVVHLADLIDALMPARPTAVTATTNRVLHADLPGAAETAGLVLIAYDNGAVAAIDCSWSQPESAPTWGGLTLNVTGTRGDLYIDAFRPRLRGLDTASGRPLELPYGDAGNERLIATFLELARTRVITGPDPEPGLGTALRTLSIVLAAAESAATGRTVAVEPLDG
jgi:1,5-anhydro-D-fructose reductase (1,5-anhydro-D-mannitol-forming)